MQEGGEQAVKCRNNLTTLAATSNPDTDFATQNKLIRARASEVDHDDAARPTTTLDRDESEPNPTISPRTQRVIS